MSGAGTDRLVRLSGRVVAVCAGPAPEGSLEAAMLEDVVDLVEGMQQAAGAVLATPSVAADARRVTWFGMPVLELQADSTADVAAALRLVGAAGADEVVLVTPDVPDLPPLLLGKLFSALSTAEVAVAPAADGGLVAVASRLPAPAWLDAAGVTLDASDALETLRAHAPRRAVHVGAGWHRVRDETDAGRLDPGLEGWEATRAWLGRAV